MQAVDVIVVAYNEENTIASTLKSISRQVAHPGVSFRVLVVPNGCSDRTADVARDTIRGLPRREGIAFDLIERTEGGKTKTINFALDRTSAPLIICTDSDITFSPDCFRQVVESFRDPRIKVSGPEPAFVVPDGLEDTLLGDFYRVRQLLSDVVGGRLFPTGAVMAFRRGAIKHFPESFVGGDYMWLSYEVASNFGTQAVTVTRDAKFYAIRPHDWLDLIRQESRWELNSDRLLEHFPEFGPVAAEYAKKFKTRVLTSKLRDVLVSRMHRAGISPDALELAELIPKLLHDNSIIMGSKLARADGTWEPIASTKTLN